MVDTGDVMRVLGRLETKVDTLTKDLDEDRENGRVSRARIHERMDEFSNALGTVQSDIRVSAQTDAQVRNELNGMAKAVQSVRDETASSIETLREEISPTIKAVSTLKLAGAGIGGVLVLLGVTVASAGEMAAGAVRNWLKL